VQDAAREFDAALGPAEQMRALGCERRVISAEEAVKIEPALGYAKDRLAGATYTPDDESGDAQRFTVELARIAKDAGVKFLFSHDVKALRKAGGRIEFVEATDADGRFVKIKGDAYVLAMGAFSALHAQALDLWLNVYPAKGYSVTMPVLEDCLAYKVSLTDDEHKLVFSRLGDRLRIAGTAELGGYGRGLSRVRCDAILRRVEQLFPGAGDASRAEFWAGLRPATPSNVPYVGRSPVRNLYFNTGHGTLGWTHACGSGHALADIVCGKKPQVAFDFTGRKIGVRPQPRKAEDRGLTPAG
jgi:D-amino-acid dehydrogenase